MSKHGRRRLASTTSLPWLPQLSMSAILLLTMSVLATVIGYLANGTEAAIVCTLTSAHLGLAFGLADRLPRSLSVWVWLSLPLVLLDVPNQLAHLASFVVMNLSDESAWRTWRGRCTKVALSVMQEQGWSSALVNVFEGQSEDSHSHTYRSPHLDVSSHIAAQLPLVTVALILSVFTLFYLTGNGSRFRWYRFVVVGCALCLLLVDSSRLATTATGLYSKARVFSHSGEPLTLRPSDASVHWCEMHSKVEVGVGACVGLVFLALTGGAAWGYQAVMRSSWPGGRGVGASLADGRTEGRSTTA